MKKNILKVLLILLCGGIGEVLVTPCYLILFIVK